MRVSSSAPLRIALAGGGTDLPIYAKKFGGRVLSVAINLRLVVLAIDGRIDRMVQIAHETSALSPLKDTPDLYLRASAARLGLDGGLSIASVSPVPSGTGLGSSGAYGVALYAALARIRGLRLSPLEVAEAAWKIECETLRMPVGPHDQYMAAAGGIQVIVTDGAEATLEIVSETAPIEIVFESLSLFYTGVRRHSKTELTGDDRARLSALHQIARIGEELESAAKSGDVQSFGSLLHQHWVAKRSASGPGVWDQAYEVARLCGAYGGKLVGAGGGGFLLFATPLDARGRVAKAMTDMGLLEVPVAIDREGVRTVDTE